MEKIILEIENSGDIENRLYRLKTVLHQPSVALRAEQIPMSQTGLVTLIDDYNHLLKSVREMRTAQKDLFSADIDTYKKLRDSVTKAQIKVDNLLDILKS